MKRIQHLKDQGVTGESMAYSFIECRIQPLQQRVHLSFEYEGTHDPSRMAQDVPSAEEVMRRVTRLFTGVTSEPYVSKLFGAYYSPNPGNLERFRSDPPKPLYEEPSQESPAARDAGDVAARPPRTKRKVGDSNSGFLQYNPGRHEREFVAEVACRREHR
ncbi:hypothetical protein C2845_PM11G02300 [Panicum miliaceum]|uniref:Uncharacterized protein n=1 Tax=Panicum miliaceum TaxID=4540 RepID=A0A3L6RQA0_PANMI|nr:hypothetical protein C2845_PM11G02300 [Panicum miliaceum]